MPVLLIRGHFNVITVASSVTIPQKKSRKYNLKKLFKTVYNDSKEHVYIAMNVSTVTCVETNQIALGKFYRQLIPKVFERNYAFKCTCFYVN